MKEIKKCLLNVVCAFMLVGIVWVVLSFFNIIAHNGLDGDNQYWRYNFFSILVNAHERDCEVSNRQSQALAKYEETKGVTIARLRNQPNQNEVDLLAHLIYGESGAEWCSDEMQWLVGAVALNRVDSPLFPNTLEGVIYQSGQYACTWDGNFDLTPDSRAYEIAEELLTMGHRDVPENVLFQAEFTQGSGIYKRVQNMCFCYK